MTKKQAIKYLTNVIERWDAFCDSHKNFTEAIKVLIKDEKNTKMTNREYIQSLDTPALAKLIERDYGCCSMCAYRRTLQCGGDCVEGIKKWLDTERDSGAKDYNINESNTIYYNAGFDTIVGNVNLS